MSWAAGAGRHVLSSSQPSPPLTPRPPPAPRPEDDAQITPVISASSADFIEGLVKDAEAKGAQLLTPFKREGNLLWPVVADRVTPDMRLAWEEPFGPALPIMRVKSVDEAVAHVNTSRLALQARWGGGRDGRGRCCGLLAPPAGAALVALLDTAPRPANTPPPTRAAQHQHPRAQGCVFTKDIDQAMYISDAMETGTVQVNSAPARGPDHFPFQGFRDSGIGSQVGSASSTAPIHSGDG